MSQPLTSAQLVKLAAPMTREHIEAAARILGAVAEAMPHTQRPHPEPKSEPDLRRLLNYKEAATYLGISIRGAKAAAAEGELVKVKIGHRVLFDRADLDEFVDRRKREA